MTMKREAKMADKKHTKFNQVTGSKPKSFKDKKVGYANRDDNFIGKRKFKDSTGDAGDTEGQHEQKKNAPKAN